MSLTALPIELIHQISDNLPSKYVFTVLRQLNRRFYAVFSDSVYWRRRFLSYRLPKTIFSRDLLNAAKTCVEVENEVLFWNRSNNGHDFMKFGKTVLNFITVDAMVLIEINERTLLVTASRDRCLRIFETNDTTVPVATVPDAHNSWINNLIPIQSQSDTLLISTGFDGSLRLWKFPTSKKESFGSHPIAKLSLKSTVVDAAFSVDTDGRVYFLCADNCVRIITIDTTNPQIVKPSGRLTYFKRQTLSIAIGKDQSLDKTRLYMSSRSQWLVALECASFTKKYATMLDSEALCVQSADSRVYCGLKSGEVAVLTLDLMLLKVVQAFSANISITRIIPTLAHLICASGNGSICVFSLGNEISDEVCRGRCFASISAVCFANSRFAIALTDCSVNLFE